MFSSFIISSQAASPAAHWLTSSLTLVGVMFGVEGEVKRGEYRDRWVGVNGVPASDRTLLRIVRIAVSSTVLFFDE